MIMSTLFMVTDTTENKVQIRICDRCLKPISQAYILPIQEGADPVGSAFYLCEECAREYSVASVRFKRSFVKGNTYATLVEDMNEEVFKV